MITVGDVRQAIEGLPDHTPFKAEVRSHDYADYYREPVFFGLSPDVDGSLRVLVQYKQVDQDEDEECELFGDEQDAWLDGGDSCDDEADGRADVDLPAWHRFMEKGDREAESLASAITQQNAKDVTNGGCANRQPIGPTPDEKKFEAELKTFWEQKGQAPPMVFGQWQVDGKNV